MEPVMVKKPFQRTMQPKTVMVNTPKTIKGILIDRNLQKPLKSEIKTPLRPPRKEKQLVWSPKPMKAKLIQRPVHMPIKKIV